MNIHLILMLLFCCFAEGAVYTYNLDSLVSGTPPGGPAPWLMFHLQILFKPSENGCNYKWDCQARSLWGSYTLTISHSLKP